MKRSSTIRRIIFLLLILSVSLTYSSDTLDETSLENRDSLILKNNRVAITAACMYSIGMVGVYTLSPIMTMKDMPEEDRKGYVFPVMLSNALLYSSVPIACVQSSKVKDLCKNSNAQTTISPWAFYVSGWISGGVGLVIFTVGAAASVGNNDPISLAPIIIGISGWTIKDLLWGIACFSSVGQVRKAQRECSSKKMISLHPYINNQGTLGTKLVYHF